MIKFNEGLIYDRLDSSTLIPSVALFVALAICWWCSCSCVRCLFLVTLLDTPFSLCDLRLTLLGLKNAFLSYILSTLLTFSSLALT
jgi:hypothetical protein